MLWLLSTASKELRKILGGKHGAGTLDRKHPALHHGTPVSEVVPYFPMRTLPTRIHFSFEERLISQLQSSLRLWCFVLIIWEVVHSLMLWCNLLLLLLSFSLPKFLRNYIDMKQLKMDDLSAETDLAILYIGFMLCPGPRVIT